MPSQYVFIESRDPFESGTAGSSPIRRARSRARADAVTVFLVQNGVFATRAGARGSDLPRLPSAGVSVLADDSRSRERGIEPSELSDRRARGVDRDARGPGHGAGHQDPLALRRSHEMIRPDI